MNGIKYILEIYFWENKSQLFNWFAYHQLWWTWRTHLLHLVSTESNVFEDLKYWPHQRCITKLHQIKYVRILTIEECSNVLLRIIFWEIFHEDNSLFRWDLFCLNHLNEQRPIFHLQYCNIKQKKRSFYFEHVICVSHTPSMHWSSITLRFILNAAV